MRYTIAPNIASQNHITQSQEKRKTRYNRDYPRLLRKSMDFVSTEGIAVVLTPGRYNSAFFEHAYLAEKTGAALAFPEDLEVG